MIINIGPKKWAIFFPLAPTSVYTKTTDLHKLQSSNYYS